MIRTLLVGYGRFGRVYAKRLREHAAYDVIGVIDANDAALHDAGRDGFLTASSVKLACAASGPDLVVVATSEDSHARVALEAITSGASVLLSKPGARSTREARWIVGAAREHEVSVYVDWTPLSSHAWDTTFAEQLQLGRISTIRMTRRGSSTPRECGALWDLCPHDVAIAWRLVTRYDEAERVTSTKWATGVQLGIEHASGCVTRIEADYAAAERERRVDITCDHGVVSWLQDEDRVIVQTGIQRAEARVIDGADAITRRLDDIANTLGTDAPDDSDQLVDVISVLEQADTPVRRAA